jgi:hypothetical protein
VARRVDLAVVLGLLLAPAIVRGQYGGDPYAPAPPPPPVMPFMPTAPAFNPMMTPEWRQAGGNYQVWEQLMMQKMAGQQQAAFQQQIQDYQKWAKANPKEAAALEKAYRDQMNPYGNPAAARKKKATAKSAAAAKSATATKGAATKSAATKTAKPAADAQTDEDDESPARTATASRPTPTPPAATKPSTTPASKPARPGASTTKPAAPK